MAARALRFVAVLSSLFLSWLSEATAMASGSTTRVAIIGGGISGCATARRLAQLHPSSKITIYEIGRGAGGRASTRKTRSLPHLYINHGAPYADLWTDKGKSLVASLGPSAVAMYKGIRGALDSTTGRVLLENKEAGTSDQDKPIFVTGANGEMSTVAASLICDLPSIETKYRTMVRGLNRAKNGEWQLLDKDQKTIGSADWLVVAGSGVAHPRWTATFGGEPPLIAAEREHPDPALREALNAIAEQEVSPRLAVFFSCSGPLAQKWLSLDYDVLAVEGSSILSRIMIQGGGAGRECRDWCSVVLHSTETFALENTGVYGRSSSAARVGDASSDSSREGELIQTMTAALNEIPGMPTIEAIPGEGHFYDYGPVLHRWGNAFPKASPLPEDLSFLPSSKIAFCGDYVASSEEPRFGSFESALLSGTCAGEKIAKACLEPPSEWYGASNPMASWQGYKDPRYGGYLDNLHPEGTEQVD